MVVVWYESMSSFCRNTRMPRTTRGANSARPVNSRVKKMWFSFGSDAIAFRSTMGAQDTPTEYMVMPVHWKFRISWKFPSPTLEEPSMRNPMFTEL
ncbi:hypothetical protein EYF80_002597 [Liparis tanakae]|uniref:Uncharacterized protein n=1 Tax=Liparis tanakae TaxID=230148 RepID=A0A4Z2JB33_9TELE|nr:hypothetical protein EYF80_002597 [Liparis tanakae]